MRFNDLPPELTANLGVRKAEIARFAQLKDADEVANRLKELNTTSPGCDVFTFAAGFYYVVLLTPDFVEDTDVTHTNP